MMSFIGFIITISLLVVIHEFGHYIAARIFGVKVISFSVGFGPKIIKINSKSNEWCLSAFPLGGYVKMLDEREQTVAEEQKHLAYNNQHPFKKIIIAFAGPFFNILFAFIALSWLGMTGISELKPVIESVNLSPLVINTAKTNLLPHSQITSINNQAVTTWQDANKVFTQQLHKTSKLTFNLNYESKPYSIKFDFTKYIDNTKEQTLANAGIYPFSYLDTLSYVEPQSAAAIAGLQADDTILKLNNESIINWFQLSQIIRENPTEKLPIVFKHNESIVSTFVTPLSSIDENGQIIGKLGIMPSLNQISLAQNSFVHKYDFWGSLNFATTSCYTFIISNLQIINSMVNGSISWHNIGGPVSIAKAYGVAISHGFTEYIQLLVIISLSIAIMNLLPIPVLDGGHILIYSIEWIVGKQINKEIQHIIFLIGFILIMFVTLLAFFNDFTKLFNW